MKTLTSAALFAGAWLVLAAGAVCAQELASAEMRSLDEQVQEIKTDVLGIAAELNRLEEKLLYPSNTQLAVFVSIAEGETFRLDSMQINIDGEIATHYLYGFKELEALQNGGVQRVYTGNLPTGGHEIAVSINGKYSEMLGYSLQQLQKIGVLGVTRPEDAAEDLAAAEQLLDGLLDVYRRDKRYRHADGSLVCGIVPVTVDAPGRPRIATPEEAERICNYLQRITQEAGLPALRLQRGADMVEVS